MYTISDLVKNQEHRFMTEWIPINKNVSYNIHDTLTKIDSYYQSAFTSSAKDSLGRKKPFLNIVKGKVNIGWRATDIDRKNVRIKAKKSDDYFKAFVADLKLREWFKKSDYGSYLNKWGKSLAKYGCAVTEFIEKGDELSIQVVPWSKLIVDPVNFDDAPVIKYFDLTPAQLRKRKSYDKDMVKALIDHMEEEEKDYVTIYEAHGEMPLSFITGKEEDETEYVQQMQVMTYFEDPDSEGEDKEFVLFKGREKKHPYVIDYWDELEGRTLGVGMVEDLFQPQEFMNYSIKQMKDQLDLASKVIFQTADPQFISRNVLSDIETGSILINNDKPITQVNNNASDIGSLQVFSQQWDAMAEDITSTPDAIQGNTFPSATAFRQVALLNTEAHGIFELITENKGLAIENHMRTYILPWIETQLDTKEEIVAELDSKDLDWVDKAQSQAMAKEKARYQLLIEDRLVTDEDILTYEDEAMEILRLGGSTRYFVPDEKDDSLSWDKYFDGFTWDAEVEVTGENVEKQASLETLSNLLQSLVANPTILENPQAKVIFNKILETSGGVSPVEIPATPQVQTGNQPQLQTN